MATRQKTKCECAIGYVNGDCPLSFSNAFHAQRDDILSKVNLVALGAGLAIETRRRADDYHAQVNGQPEIWGCGRTRREAIGDLLISHAELGVRIESED